MNRFEISYWLKKNGLKSSDFTINKPSRNCPVLSVSIHTSLDISNRNLSAIPFKILTINGNLNCSGNKFSNLNNFPDQIVGDFNCSNNRLLNFEFCPDVFGNIIANNNLINNLDGIKANKSIDVSYNSLEDLNGCPDNITGNLDCSFNSIRELNSNIKTITGDLNCSNNFLTDFIKSPHVFGNIIAIKNNINSFKGINCYKSIDVSKNKITSFLYCPERIRGDFNCSENLLSDFLYAPKKIEGNFDIKNNSFKDLKDFPVEISGVVFSDNDQVFEFVNNHYISSIKNYSQVQKADHYYNSLSNNELSKIINENNVNSIEENGLTVSMNIFKNLHKYSVTEKDVTTLIKKTQFNLKDFKGHSIIHYIVNYQNNFFKNENLPKKRK